MSDIQHKLKKIRAPRVKITYDLELDGAIVKKELPCVISIISDLTGFIDEQNPIPLYQDRKFTYVDQDNLNDFLKFCKPSINFLIKINETTTSNFIVKFEKIEDFDPLYIIRQIPVLNEQYELRLKLTEIQTRVSNNSKFYNGAYDLISKKTATPEEAFKDYVFFSEDQKKYIIELFTLCPTLTLENDNVILSINKAVKDIDVILNDWLNQALHNSSYQKLEGSWLGIKYMLSNVSFSENLNLRIFNATFKEINTDLIRALDFDQSFLFQELYEKEYGTYGGNPYSLLLVDLLIEKTEEHFAFLHQLSEVACASHLPTVIGAHSNFFDLNSFQDLHKPRMMSKILNSPEYSSFKSLRARDESRYLAMVFPSFMARIPFGQKTKNIEGLNFEEDVSSHDKFCWSNAIFVYGANIANAFSEYNWFASIIGPENGGMVKNLPVYTFKDSDGDVLIKSPTETTITDRREKELSDLGFISLCHCKDENFSVFFSGQSLNKPPLYDKDTANANARLLARFQYMLNCSRFAHYIKCIMRDKIGTFTSKEEIQGFLTRWIMSYVLNMDDAPQETKAKYPLREANIQVEEIEGEPGNYNCVIFLRPHFQMEELSVSLRLVAKIPGLDKKAGE